MELIGVVQEVVLLEWMTIWGEMRLVLSCIQIKLYSWYMLGVLVKSFIAVLMLYSDEVVC